jgi:hypothetical protein
MFAVVKRVDVKKFVWTDDPPKRASAIFGLAQSLCPRSLNPPIYNIALALHDTQPPSTRHWTRNL